MKAVVLDKTHQLKIIEIEEPECPPGGILIKVKACGICSSDVKMVKKGHPALQLPRILGHEIAGIVYKSRTREFSEGDHVQVAPGLRCGICKMCKRGFDNQCFEREILGFTRDGGFREYIDLPIEGRIKGGITLLPPNISYKLATLIEPLACCINAHKILKVSPEDNVLIIGGGPIGIMHAILSKLYGAKSIFITEKDINRIAYLNNFKYCIDEIIDIKVHNLKDFVNTATNSYGIDILILACSDISIDTDIIDIMASRSKISIFSGNRYDHSNINWNTIHYKEINIVGTYGCTLNDNLDAMHIISKNTLLFKKIITDSILLEDIVDGIERISSKTALKIIAEV